MARKIRAAIAAVEAVEAANERHRQLMAASRPGEAAFLLRAREAEHSAQMKARLAGLQERMAEAACAAADMREAGLADDPMLNDLADLRSLCVSLGADDAEMDTPAAKVETFNFVRLPIGAIWNGIEWTKMICNATKCNKVLEMKWHCYVIPKIHGTGIQAVSSDGREK
eukprot:scaffold226890_cov41-Prasinocladus_malaysianus.AAC.3